MIENFFPRKEPLTEAEEVRIQKMREAFAECANVICERGLPNRHRSLAFSLLEQAAAMATKSITHDYRASAFKAGSFAGYSRKKKPPEFINNPNRLDQYLVVYMENNGGKKATEVNLSLEEFAELAICYSNLSGKKLKNGSTVQTISGSVKLNVLPEGDKRDE